MPLPPLTPSPSGLTFTHTFSPVATAEHCAPLAEHCAPLAVSYSTPSYGASPAPRGPCCATLRLALGHASEAAARRWAGGKSRGRGMTASG